MNEQIEDCLRKIRDLITDCCETCEDKEVFCSTHCILGTIWTSIEESVDLD